MLRFALPLFLCSLAASALAPTAQGADLVAGVTALAIQASGATPHCPTAAEADGSLLAAANRVGAGPRPGFNASYDAVARFTLSVAATVVVCDPTLASAGRPLGPITGSAINPPTDDVVGFGLRSLGAPITQPGAAAAVGDRFVLPAVSAAATVDLVVRTPAGSAGVRLGPFPTAPVAVKVAGTLQGPIAVAELADGGTVQTPVVAPRAATPKLGVTIKRNRLKLRLTGIPGAFLTSMQAPSPGDVRLAGYDPNGVVRVADAKGVAAGVQSDLRGAKYVLVGILDADRRTFFPQTCRLTWKRRTLTKVRCAPTTAAERAHPLPSDNTGPLATGLEAALRARAAAARPAAPPTQSSARRSAAPALLPVDTTVVTRLRGGDTRFFDEEDLPLVGDVNGDGRPDYGIGESEIALSTPGGWTRVPLRTDDPDLDVVPDLTGDGIDDFAILYEDRIFGGDGAWATSAPSAIDLRRGRPLTANDLAVVHAADRLSDAGSMFGLPDATGDGRPEVGLMPAGSHDFGVFASESLPLGQASQLPRIRTTDFADELTSLRRIAEAEDEESGDAEVDGNVLLTRRGALLWRATGKAVELDDLRSVERTVSFRIVAPGAPWAPSAPVSLTLPGFARIDDYDPATGEVLITTVLEGCKPRTFNCVGRVRRVDASGRVTATASVRSLRAVAIRASFAGDGPDADARPEVVIHEGELHDDSVALSTIPGLSGTVALWSSTQPVVALAALPVFATNGAPLIISGPLLQWQSPDGRPQLAGYVEAGTGRRFTQTLTMLSAPR